MSKLTLETDGETDVIVTRRFAAPPEAVFRAHTDRDLEMTLLAAREAFSYVAEQQRSPG